jgi:hypothetical protein
MVALTRLFSAAPAVVSSSRKAPRHSASAPVFWNARRIGVSSRPRFGATLGLKLVVRAELTRKAVSALTQTGNGQTVLDAVPQFGKGAYDSLAGMCLRDVGAPRTGEYLIAD